MFTNNDEKNTRRFSPRGIAAVSAAVVLVAAVSVFLFGFASTKHITIYDADHVTVVTTAKNTVEELLEEQNVILREGDVVSEELKGKLKNKEEIIITRARKIVLTADGTVKDIYSIEEDLGSALKKADITLNETDEVTPALDTPVTEGMQAQIVRVKTEIVKEEQLMSFHEITVPRDDKEKGYVSVVQEGDTGWAEATFSVTTRDGEIIAKEMLTQDVIVEPVAKVIEYGTSEGRYVQTSRGGVRYKRVLQCNATAYDPSPSSNGGYGGRTATGMAAQYGVIAVDPRVIPLGSRVYVESSDGGKSWVYGFAIAADTGGAIKGNKVDLCYNTKAECYQFGRRSATVYILD